MIKKLRKKIIAINVICVCIVFFVAEALICMSGINRLDKERQARVSAAFEYNNSGNDFCDSEMFKDIALVIYNTQTGETEYCIGEESNLTEDQLKSVVEEIVLAKKDSGWIKFLKMQYDKRVYGDYVKIIVHNSFSRTNSMTPFLIMGGATLLIGILCYLAISIILARIALKPVEESWTKQKQFVADASHELKTPLSVIMANTDIIASHKDETVASQMKWIESTRFETKRMADLVADLLFLAKNDDGLKVQMEDVNLSDCVEMTVLSYDAVFYENGKDFKYEIAPNININGNDGQLKQLTTILLDNANRYSAGSGNIFLKLSIAGKHAVLSVANDSGEITDEQLSHIFDRFYTFDKSRNSNNGGNGLGLSIAKIICETHGGNLTVDYNNGRIEFRAELTCKGKKELTTNN